VLSEEYVEEIVLAYEVCQLLVESSNLLSTCLYVTMCQMSTLTH
jgi:hypothetical protein